MVSDAVRAARRTVCAACLLLAAAGLARAADADAQARAILEATGVQGGLIVHLGCGDGALTAALHASESYLVQGLDPDAAKVAEARKLIQKRGLYGKVSVDRLADKRLPYVDGLVNLIVASGKCPVSSEEIARVLAPGGRAALRSGSSLDTRHLTLDPQAPSGLAGRSLFTKPVPREIDEWTHYLHDASNNAVANDTVIGPPRRLQWVGSPRWARHHDHIASLNAMVSAGGRLFYIFDEGPTASLQMPPQWRLVARDAFNGTVLWKRPVPNWWPHLWPLKSGPAFLPRRLVAVGDRVYVTLGLEAPLTALDAATGETVRTYEGTTATEEILADGGVLFVQVNEKPKPLKITRLGDLHALNNTWQWDGQPRSLAVIEADTGKELWREQRRIVPLTLTADARRVLFHNGEKILCLDRATGKLLWASEPIPRLKTLQTWAAPTLVVHDGVVVFAGAEKMVRHKGGKDTMTALDANTGRTLWTAPHPPSGYDSPEDVFVIGGLVWTAPTTNKRDTGLFTGRDLRTGEIKARFPADDGPHMPHHRCHRAKATVRYIVASRTGIELVDLAAKHWDRNDWVRGGCLYGVMPANGLIYTPPHSCACYILAKLNGLNALAPQGRLQVPGSGFQAPRLERGPGYGFSLDTRHLTLDTSADWPTFRHDAARSGRTKTAVPTDLKPLWRTAVGGKLSSAVIADGKLFVAAIDAHTVHALDASDGKRLWSYTTGGRVDSPPTIHGGRVLFGSADGWVYCLRASDGALAWRFRGAPGEQRLVAYEQVESVWPIHGSVLMVGDVVHCAAGRSMFLDGGLRYLRLDPATGKLLSETKLDDRHPKTGKKLDAGVQWPNLPVALPDVLSCDGKSVYMRSQPFDLEGRRRGIVTPRDFRDQTGETAHLFCPTGFLDDAWWHRSYWMYGKSPVSAAGGWYLAGWRAPAGRIMVAADENVYVYGRQPRHFPATTWIEYHLFSAGKAPKIVPRDKTPPKKISDREKAQRKRRGAPSHPATRWSDSVPILARAMVLAGPTLFVAGPPDLVDEQAATLRLGDPEMQAKLADHAAALAGRKGGLLLAVGADDGRKLATLKLASPPVFDGLAAARGRLFLAALDGSIQCYGAEK